MASDETREDLQQSLEAHKRELGLAVRDLGAAAQPWNRVDDAIRRRPAAWMVAGVIAGIWLGRR